MGKEGHRSSDRWSSFYDRNLSGAATTAERVMSGSVYRVLCGARQLGLAVKSVYGTVFENFQEPFYMLIS